MKVVDIIPRQICVMVELSDKECSSLLSFFEKGMPLYAKVHLRSATDESLSVAEDYTRQLKSVLKTIKEEIENDS